VPALAFGFAARIMRLARGEDLPVRVAQSLCIAFSALLCVFEIRHAVNGGDVFGAGSSMLESGLFAATALVFSIVLTRLDLMRASPVFPALSGSRASPRSTTPISTVSRSRAAAFSTR